MTEKTWIKPLWEKAYEIIRTNKEAIIFAVAVFLFGTIGLGGSYPFGYALYIAGDKHRAAGFWGLALSCLFTGAGTVYLAIALGLYSFKKLTEGKTLPKSALPLTAITAAAFIWAASSNGVYSLAMSVSVLVVLPLFCLLYSTVSTPHGIKPAAGHGGYGAFLFTAVFFTYRLFGAEPLPAVLALFCTFAAAAGGGMLYGGFYGLVCGLGCGSGVAAVCGVTGLVSGLFSIGGSWHGPLCGSLAGICVGFYFFGGQDGLWLLFTYIAAGLCYMFFAGRVKLLPFGGSAAVITGKQAPAPPFAEAFFAISQSAATAAQSETEAARTADPYADLSLLLSAAGAEKETENHTDNALSQRMAELLYTAGIKAERVQVTGGRRKRLRAEGVELERLTLSTDALKRLVSSAFDRPVKEPQFFPKGGKATLIMESAPLLKIECSRKKCPKRGEELCGDTVSFFSSDAGYFYALISDGMGSGKAAADCSRLAGVFLEKLLSAGADRKTALSMLNNFLASREGEVFATVDLFEADLYTGKGVLTKAGAAPSFILRDGRCNILHSPTLPAGIIRHINAARLSFDLKDGDTLIMLSDGIAGEDGSHAAALIEALPEGGNTAAIADSLLKNSIKNRACSDDMSVCVIKIIAA